MMESSVDLYAVIWNGEMLELETWDAIAFSRADAEAVVAASPGRRECYSIEPTDLSLLAASSEPYSSMAERLQERIRVRDFSPLMVRSDVERQRRTR
jgi:hypothetical protein